MKLKRKNFGKELTILSVEIGNLKTETWLFLYKTGDVVEINNYRPISLVTQLSKEYIKNRVVSYLSKYSILSENQFGFREKMSTPDAELALTNKINHSLNNSKPSLCILLDLSNLSKAFDTVCNPLLLQSLSDIGIRSKVLHLFETYLADRRQTVRVDDVPSAEEVLEHGIPHRSVLGPTLFNIYIHDLFST